MDALILAAGVGSRLGTLTLDKPKCLLEVGGGTILSHQLAALKGVGVSRTIIVTGYRAEDIRTAVKGESVELIHNPDFRTTNVLYSWFLGSATLSGDHIFLHGDTIFEPALLSKALTGDQPVVLSVDRHACGAEEMKVEVSGTHVKRVSKELDVAHVIGEFTGVMLVRARVLKRLRHLAKALLSHGNGQRLFVEAAIQSLIDESPSSVGWIDITGLRWREIDFVEDLEAAREIFS